MLLAVALVLTACGGTSDPPQEDAAPITDAPGADDAPGAGDASETDDAPAPDLAEPPDDEVAVDPDLGVALKLTDVARMDAPTAGAVGPDGVLYLTERAGTIHPLTDDGVGAAVLDISTETTTDGERGLLGIAFADDGSELYLSSTDVDGDTVIAAMALDADGALLPDQRRTLLTIDQPFANHNGGNIVVGPDGMLYIGMGDGGGAGDPVEAGQDLGTRLGSLLRIDPGAAEPYGVPSDNPFVGDDGARDEIWAYGLRNPWRFSFDAATDELYIADVGQDTREEINWLPAGAGAGANFGWNLMEGTLEFAGAEPDDHVPPVYEYETRGPQGCSITGGYVYRGSSIPDLVGAYLYSDFCGATLYGIVVDDGEVVDEAELSVGGDQIVSFAQDTDGELYLLDFGGAVRRIDPA